MKNTLFFSILILLGVAGLPAIPKAQTRHYVRLQSQGQNNGTSWADAFTDLQTALDVAVAGDEVWVSKGTYLPTAGNGRNKRFSLASNVRLYGGFSGSETDLSQRDPDSHPTVLNGNIGNPTDSTDNVYTILYLDNPEAETRIDGLVFESGFAHSDTTFLNNSPTLSGGAVYVMAKNGVGLPVFAHCTFRNNSAKVNGGAVFVFGQGSIQSMPLFHFCRFENNAAGAAGGAVYLWGGSTLDRGIEFWGCKFEGNSAVNGQSSRGGGVFYRKSPNAKETLELVSCDVFENSASILAGFLFVQLEASKSRTIIDSCYFAYNFSENGGASVFQESAFSTKETYLVIANSFFQNNYVNGDQSTGANVIMPELSTAVPGQVIRDTIILLKNYFESNDMSYTALSSANSFSSVIYDIFYQNKQLSFSSVGKDLIFENNVLDSNLIHGTLFSPVRNIFFSNNKMTNNELDNNINSYFNLFSLAFNNFNDSLMCVGNTLGNNQIAWNPNVSSQAYMLIQNNLIFQNKSTGDPLPSMPFFHNPNSEYSHNLSDVLCEDYFDPAVCGAGNIVTSDPGFRDAVNGDFRLLSCSPAVNAGDNAIVTALGITTDLDGAQRIKDGQVDMGAYESPTLSEHAEAEVQASCIGQNNGAVDFNLPSGCPPFDFAWSSPPASGADTTGLTPGLYTFTVTDQKGKVMVQTLVVQEASPLTTLSDVTPSTCSTCADGSIVVTSVSGDAPFMFQWSNGADGQIANGLLPGVYFLTLSDAWGCDTVLAFEVPYSIAATEQEDGKSAPSVWPNPCTDVLYLDWQGASRWTLVGPYGRMVRSLNLISANRQSVDLSPLPAGIYISVFESESGRVDRSSVVLVR